MAITLQKGQKVDLTKGRAGLSSITVGLGWDPVAQGKGKGILGGLFGGGSAPDIDCDASVLLLDQNGKLTDKKNLIYFGNKVSADRSVKHSGDNLTGDGDGDDEQIVVDLNMVSPSISKMVFVVNIYSCVSRKQDFGMIQNAFIRVVNNSNNEELIHFNLTDNYSGLTSLFVGEIYRHNGEWKFNAIGDGTKDTSISEIANKYA
ncbi:Stress response protein SCP2 [Bacillus sp. OV322]|uniref:TerD family protein n=1 Tax=Bacillus sp. OV322 TaxID=1882764 RepID=UPI0008EEF74A|nr:TerD family protein [Bacillus sp. OV322]SFC87462.1 Stress response protein SCP2 [Bacillus sp. OV322]